MRVKIVPNDDPAAQGTWIVIPEINLEEFEAIPTVADQFLLLRKYIPDAHRPVKFDHGD